MYLEIDWIYSASQEVVGDGVDIKCRAEISWRWSGNKLHSRM
jgi:hypothetical protein